MSRLGILACALALALSAVSVWWLWKPAILDNPTATTALHLRLDADGDGQLTVEELAPTLPPKVSAEIHDLDRDGLVSPGELEAALLWVTPTWLHCRKISRSGWVQ